MSAVKSSPQIHHCKPSSSLTAVFILWLGVGISVHIPVRIAWYSKTHSAMPFPVAGSLPSMKNRIPQGHNPRWYFSLPLWCPWDRYMTAAIPREVMRSWFSPFKRDAHIFSEWMHRRPERCPISCLQGRAPSEILGSLTDTTHQQELSDNLSDRPRIILVASLSVIIQRGKWKVI